MTRIHALSRAHDQITRGNWGSAPLRDLFRTEVAAYFGERANRIEMDGPDVLIAPRSGPWRWWRMRWSPIPPSTAR